MENKRKTLNRNAKVGDEILILKHNFSQCKGVRKVIDIDDDTAYFMVVAPSSFHSDGKKEVKCGTPIDRFKVYEGEPAYVVLAKPIT